MKTAVIQNKDGKFVLTGFTKNWDSLYVEKLIEYTNLIYPLFEEAKKYLNLNLCFHF